MFYGKAETKLTFLSSCATIRREEMGERINEHFNYVHMNRIYIVNHKKTSKNVKNFTKIGLIVKEKKLVEFCENFHNSLSKRIRSLV